MRDLLRPILCSAVVGLAALVWARAAPAPLEPAVATYPSSQSIAATGALPRGGGRQLVYNAAIGEVDDALLVVRGATTVAIRVAGPGLQGLSVRLFFAHFVAAGGRMVPDALEPWDGTARRTEQSNQPIVVELEVPYGSQPGRYGAALAVTADGRQTTVPLRATVFRVTLPRPGSSHGNLLTSFHVTPESYVAKAAQLYHFTNNDQRIAANRALFAFLASYRLSPASWGFGEPRASGGYASSSRWWLDSAGNFLSELGSAPGFAALRIPISNNRTSERNYIAGLSPFKPDTWCDYLRQVRAFWAQHEVLRAESLPYLYGFDEPDFAGQRVVARQAAVLHRCFPGGEELMTGNPIPANRFLWDGKGGNDLDIWTVLSRRYYGMWTSPRTTRAGRDRGRQNLALIDRVRSRGKMVWSYTYTGHPGTPGFAATEPVSNPRLFMLWNALEGIDGVLYAQGTTSYTKDDPLQSIGSGEFVLLYPGPNGPLASARLEQIRDGIEDWAILDVVRKRRGAGAVRAILGRAGLFSATRAGVQLGCTVGCQLRTATTFAWPRWSRDASTPRRIEAARLAALEAASR